MIRPAQLKLLERARETSTPDPAVFAEVLRRCGVDSVEALPAQGYGRLMDHLTIVGFKCRQRPILSAATRKLVEEAGRQLGFTPHTYASDMLGYGGAADLRDFAGRGLVDLLSRWEMRGLDVARFVARRRSVTPAQVELIRSLWREWTGPSAEGAQAFEAGLNAWLERYHRASSLRFLTSTAAGKAITSLRSMKARSRAGAAQLR